MIGTQKERSEYERGLSEGLRNALDTARSLIDPMTRAKITYEQAAIYVNSHLPEGDSGRMRVFKQD